MYPGWQPEKPTVLHPAKSKRDINNLVDVIVNGPANENTWKKFLLNKFEEIKV